MIVLINALRVIILMLVTSSANALNANSPTIINTTIEPAFITLAKDSLPESTAIDPAFLNTDFNPYLTLNQDANVYMSFIDEGAGYKNSLGYFTFENNSFTDLTKGDIDTDSSGIISLSELDAVNGVDYGFLYSNLSKSGSGGSLLTGDTVQVTDATISAGKSVSFFLSQNAYTGGDTVSDAVLTGNDQTFYGLDFLNPEADFTYEFGSSSSNSRHTAMLFSDETEQNVIMGFEDLNRVDPNSNDWNIASDEDFNDAIFMVYSDPVDAFGGSNIATAPLPLMTQSIVGIIMLSGLIVITCKKEKPSNRRLLTT